MMVPRKLKDHIYMLPPVRQKSVIHLQVEPGTFCHESLSRCRAVIMVLKAELKSTNRILAQVPEESRC